MWPILPARPVDFWRATLRFLLTALARPSSPFLGGYYFVIDCLFVGLAPSKRALHDMVSGCLVLREGAHSPFVR